MAREQLQNIMISDYVVTSVDIERSDFDGKTGLSTLAEISANLSIQQDLSEYAKKEEVNIHYSSDEKRIYLSAGDHVSDIDAVDFIKDGMVNSVSVDQNEKKLVITFNTDSGKEAIRIPLSDFAKIYTAGNGLSIDGTTIGVSADYALSDDVTEGLAKKVDLTSFSWNDDTTIGQMFSDLSNALKQK